MPNIFPRGIAVGKSFYDRTTERKKLKQNIDNTIHTALIAPRRYGKTSLIAQVIHENKIDHIWIDFMTIMSKEDMQIKFFQKISTLIPQPQKN